MAIFDLTESIDRQRTILINEEAIEELLEYAENNNVMVGIVTSRNFKGNQRCARNKSNLFMMINTIINLLGRQYFSFVYYTNESSPWKNHKDLALKHLYETYYDQNVPKKTVCLIDDNQVYCETCEVAEFSVIRAHVNYDGNDNYLNQARAFIQSSKMRMTPR